MHSSKSNIDEKCSAHLVYFYFFPSFHVVKIKGFHLMMKVPVVSLTGSDIVESNPGKFRLGESELKERKDFVERTRKSVQVRPLFDFFKVYTACCYSPGVIMFLCFSCVSQFIWTPFWAMFQWFEDICSGGTAECDT